MQQKSISTRVSKSDFYNECQCSYGKTKDKELNVHYEESRKTGGKSRYMTVPTGKYIAKYNMQ